MPHSIGIGTLVKYLFGSRQAILDIAACPKAIWLGLLFVLSAGLAREYDGEDLLHEPWHALIPVAASLATSFLLYWLARLVFKSREISYRSFLGLYWLTAPLAWIYAIPVERYFEAADAVRANLWFLGIVSLWRVLLMTRVVKVVFKCGDFAALFVILFFADTVAAAVVWFTPLPIFQIMGGIRLTESEQTIQLVGLLARLVTVAIWPLLAIATAVVAVRHWREIRGPNWAAREEAAVAAPSKAPNEPVRVGAALWIAAACSLLVWVGVLPATQTEQINRRRVEKEMRNGNLYEAIQYMSQRDRDDFPPHWDPPPRSGFGEETPSLIDLRPLLEEHGTADWVRALYREKIDANFSALNLSRLSDEQLARDLEQVKANPPEDSFWMNWEISQALENRQPGGEPSAPLSDERRAMLEELRAVIKSER